MKIISLWQPWASLWAGGAKKIETRSWPWRGHFPLTIAVHASKRFTRAEQTTCLGEHFKSALASLGYERVGELPLGCVVGFVTIERVYCFRTSADIPDYPERAFGDYSLGRFGWQTTGNRLFKTPIPLTGKQGRWDWDPPADLEFADGNKLDLGGRAFGAMLPSLFESKAVTNA